MHALSTRLTATPPQAQSEARASPGILHRALLLGDPVKGRKLIRLAKDKGIKLTVPPYPHKRAFTVSPAPEYLESLRDLLEHTWGVRKLSVLDPFSGGGSIPFEAMRYGFETYANELNSVASVILKATLDYPFRFGASLADDVRKYGQILADRVRTRLEPYFPVEPGESIHAYVWARTVTCPYTGKPIPLSPNWWLQKIKDRPDRNVAAVPVFSEDQAEARFTLVSGESACARANPAKGTVKGGNAVSPWASNQPVDGDIIKRQAQNGGLGEQLYAVVTKTASGYVYRLPTERDLSAFARAQLQLKAKLATWEATDVLPHERITSVSNYDRGHRLYGIERWMDAFSARQLLAHGEIVTAIRELHDEILKAEGSQRAQALTVLFRLAADKGLDYNSRYSRWHSGRGVVVNTFDKHGYGFLWSYPEFDAAHNLVPWVLGQVADAFAGIAGMATLAPQLGMRESTPPAVHLLNGSSLNLSAVASRSVHTVVTDPPYHDNVMYSECADFFYVWMKRNLHAEFPELFEGDETNKDDEAVANHARFAVMGRRKKELATADYERKMSGAFREMHRVLVDEGTLTVMFTHKKVEAWDTLATSLIGAGFAIKSSWPVHTESEHSTHQAKKNAAQSTILLTCRKREPRTDPVWWEDIKGHVRDVARDTAVSLERQGIRGVDLYIATFGPTLAILSESWPVLTAEVDEKGNPKLLRPEVALDHARTEVVALRKQNLLLGRSVQFDKATDWYLMAWDAFGAAEFPADEARKLALALDLDLERDVIASKRLVTKKQSTVVMQEPKARRKRDMVDPDKRSFDCWIDAAHTAMLLYAEDGAQVCQRFLHQANLLGDITFKAVLQALINAIPRTRLKGRFVRPEAEVLESMRLAFFDELIVPVEEEIKLPEPKDPLFAYAGIGDAGPNGDDEGDEDPDDEDEDEDGE